jgi:hypothetical protein
VRVWSSDIVDGGGVPGGVASLGWRSVRGDVGLRGLIKAAVES